MFAILLLFVAALGLSGDDSPTRVPPRNGRAGKVGDTLPPWVPPGASMAKAPPPQAKSHGLLASGSWYWDDERNMPGKPSDGAPTWVLLTRIDPPPSGAQLVLVRIWMRATWSNKLTGQGDGDVVAGQWDLSGSLATPLLVGDQKVQGQSLLVGRPVPPVDFRLRRNADGSVDVEASNRSPLAQNYAMVLEFTYRS